MRREKIAKGRKIFTSSTNVTRLSEISDLSELSTSVLLSNILSLDTDNNISFIKDLESLKAVSSKIDVCIPYLALSDISDLDKLHVEAGIRLVNTVVLHGIIV